MTSALPSILEAILSPELKSPGKSSSARLLRGMKLVQFKKKLRHSRPGENCIAGVCRDRVISLACLYCETEKMQAFFFFPYVRLKMGIMVPCKAFLAETV